MGATKPKTRYLAEVSIVHFLRKHKVVSFITLTEPGRAEGEHYWTKDEAEARFKPLADRFRRERVEWLVFWERQQRGSWHPHILCSKRYWIGKRGEGGMRDWLTVRGWGDQMKFRQVTAPVSMFRNEDSFGMSPEKRDERLRGWRIVRYLCKYITKSIVEDTCSKQKAFGGSAAAKCGGVSFKWVPAVCAAAFLYAMGDRVFFDLYGRHPHFREMRFVIRLGVEDQGWQSVDPWWEFTSWGSA